MKLPEAVIHLVTILSAAMKPDGSKHIRVTHDGVAFGSHFISIDSESITLLGKQNVLSRLHQSGEKTTLSIENFGHFVAALGETILRMNHMGISYYCDDMEKEVDEYRALLNGTNVTMHAEPSEHPEQKWIFLRDTSDPELPMFELVLTQNKTLFTQWTPHVQIDIDTAITIEKLREATTTYLGKGFIQWELDDPTDGVLLAMGVLGEVNGVKLVLGLGTDKRNARTHTMEALPLAS